MIRTTINLPVQLHHQLQYVAKGQNQTLANVVRKLLERGLVQQKERHLKQVYASLRQVKGISKDNLSDVSTTMNERLYGPAGAWKGRDE